MLSVKMHGYDIVIRIDANELAQAAHAKLAETLEDDGGKLLITPTKFAKSVVEELTREDEDGTTVVHKMFDTAFEQVLEDGADGVELTYTKKPPVETLECEDGCCDEDSENHEDWM